jgi:hypothetical protein
VLPNLLARRPNNNAGGRGHRAAPASRRRWENGPRTRGPATASRSARPPSARLTPPRPRFRWHGAVVPWLLPRDVDAHWWGAGVVGPELLGNVRETQQNVRINLRVGVSIGLAAPMCTFPFQGRRKGKKSGAISIYLPGRFRFR